MNERKERVTRKREKGYTLEAIAKTERISRERVRQIIEEEKKKMILDVNKMTDEELLEEIKKLRSIGVGFITPSSVANYEKTDILKKEMQKRISEDEWMLDLDINRSMFLIADKLTDNYGSPYEGRQKRRQMIVPEGKYEEWSKIIGALCDILAPYFGNAVFCQTEQKRKEEEKKKRQEIARYEHAVEPMRYTPGDLKEIVVNEKVYKIGEFVRILYGSIVYTGCICEFGKSEDVDCVKIVTENKEYFIIPIREGITILKEYMKSK